MKKLKSYLASSLASAVTMICLSSGITSCVDLNVQPPLDISNELALSTSDGLQNGLNASYALLRSGSLYGGNLVGSTEILADQVVVGGGGFGQLEMARRGMTFFNPEGRGIWQDGYNAINRVNNVIAAVPKVDGLSNDTRNRILGECYAIRAMMHFEIVRLFAQPWGATADNSHRGIPLRVEPTAGASNARVRPSSVAQVYTQVISDLNQAIMLLPESNGIFINRLTARAFLARVLLQRGDFAGAFAAADAVVQSGRYRLNTNVRDVFDTPGTSESLLEFVSREPVEDAGGGVQGYFRQDDGLSPVLSLDAAVVRTIRTNANDKRGTDLIKSADDQFFTTKFQKVFMNMPSLRYAEVLLIRAEAAARTNNAAAALVSVNQVRQRAGLAALANLSGDALLNAILTERSTELAFEGHRLHDLKRLQRNIGNAYLPQEAPLPWNSQRLVLQIPDVERNGTPADFWN